MSTQHQPTKEPELNTKDITTLKCPPGRLTDKYMFVANYVMKRDYPNANDLHDS